MLTTKNSSLLLIVSVLSLAIALLFLQHNYQQDRRIAALSPQQEDAAQEEIPPKENEGSQFHIDLPRLEGVQKFNDCAALNELRDVDFTNPSLQQLLCEDTPAYALNGGKFPLCQLNRNLPHQFYSRVRKGARLASVRRAMGDGFISMYTFDNEDIISQALLKDHQWEISQIQMLLGLLKKFTPHSVTFLDIGSNLGAYSVQARVEGFPVVAVDANIRTLIRLQLSAKKLKLLDDKMKLFWCFISDEVALKRISWGADASNCNVGSASGRSSGWRQQADKTIEDTIPVMTVRADELRAHIGTRNVIMKMDIESGEHLFMKTGQKLFSEFNILALQMEFWRKIGHLPNTSPFHEFVTNFMTSRNYSLLSLGGYRVQNLSTFTDWDGIWVRNDFLHEVVRS